MKPRCYLAAPLFSDAERTFNEALAHVLERTLTVFLPQRDGQLLRDLLDAGEPLESARQRVFLADTAAIRRSDVIVAVLDGPALDDGVAFELGFARALDKNCIGLATDSRRSAPYFQNPMWQESLSEVFPSVSELAGWVEMRFGETSSRGHRVLRMSPRARRR
jgi:nucleoside 2-deoxyribosyltransferase